MRFRKTRHTQAIAGLVAIALLALLLNFATLYAAGETLMRGAIVATAGTTSAAGITLRSSVGQPVAGVRSTDGASLCSGVSCPSASLPDDNPSESASWAWLPLIGGGE